MKKIIISMLNKLMNTSVKMKVLGITLGLVFLMGITSIVIVRELLVIHLTKDLDRRAISIGNDLASRGTDFTILQDIYSLHKLLKQTEGNNPDIEYIFIMDNNNETIVHSLGPNYEVTPELIGLNQFASNGEFNLITFQSDAGIIHDVVAPMLGGDVGYIRVGLNEKQIYKTINKLTYSLILSTALIGIIGFIISFFLTKIMYRDLTKLIYVSSEVGKGKLDLKVDITSNDEIGRLGKEFNKMIERLRKKHIEKMKYVEEIKYKEELRLKLLDKVITAQEEERKRIARELHDETSQSLTSIILGLSMLEEAEENLETKRKLNELKEITEKTIEEVHHISWSLRPSALDDYGLLPAIKMYAIDYMRKYETEVDIQVIGFDGIRLPSMVEVTIYRVIQEALTNSARHSHAENISIIIKHVKNIVSLIIEDDGKGFDVSKMLNGQLTKDHLGLRGMQERIESIGGRFIIESNLELGTSIYVSNIKIGSDILED